MTLSEYLIEAVTSKKSKGYFDFSKIDIDGMSEIDFLEMMSCVPSAKELSYDTATVVSGLISMGKYKDAVSEISRNIGDGRMTWFAQPEKRYNIGGETVSVFYTSSGTKKTYNVWDLYYQNDRLVRCSCVEIPSGKSLHRGSDFNIKTLEDTIKEETND